MNEGRDIGRIRIAVANKAFAFRRFVYGSSKTVSASGPIAECVNGLNLYAAASFAT
jgi:hypothetical protein